MELKHGNQKRPSLPSIVQEDLRRKAIKAVMDSKKQVEIVDILHVKRQAYL